MAHIALFHSVLGLRSAELSAAQRLRRAGHEVVTPDLGVDLALDHVGGRAFAACLPAPRSTARSSTSASSTRRRTIDLDALSYHHLRVHGVSFGVTRAAELGAVIAAAGHDLLPAVADGRVRPS
ncbi:dienelactone hydrolase family protein, partial [Streptomyces sp. NPDC048650]